MQVPKNVYIDISEVTLWKLAAWSVGDFSYGISILELRLPGYLRFRLQQQIVVAAAA